MDTLIKSDHVNVSVKEAKTVRDTSLAGFWESLEENRIGITTMIVVVMTCLGGLAAAVAVQENGFKLMAVAITTMLVEVLIIAVVPMRFILSFAALALLVDLAILLF